MSQFALNQKDATLRELLQTVLEMYNFNSKQAFQALIHTLPAELLNKPLSADQIRQERLATRLDGLNCKHLDQIMEFN